MTGGEDLPPERVAEMLSRGEVQLVDVRGGDEHEAGHVPGSLHLPLERLAEDSSTLEPDRPVVFYCRTGQRSAMAREAATASGREAYAIAGGLEAWAEQGLPLEPEDGHVADRRPLPPA